MHIASRKEVVSREWKLRCDRRLLPAGGRLRLERPGVPHISAHPPGTHFWIAPRADVREITASSLVKVDQHCNKLHDTPFPVTRPAS